MSEFNLQSQTKSADEVIIGNWQSLVSEGLVGERHFWKGEGA